MPYGAPPKPEEMPDENAPRYGAPPRSEMSHEEFLHALKQGAPQPEDWKSRMTGAVGMTLGKLWNHADHNNPFAAMLHGRSGGEPSQAGSELGKEAMEHMSREAAERALEAYSGHGAHAAAAAAAQAAPVLDAGAAAAPLAPVVPIPMIYRRGGSVSRLVSDPAWLSALGGPGQVSRALTIATQRAKQPPVAKAKGTKRQANDRVEDRGRN